MTTDSGRVPDLTALPWFTVEFRGPIDRLPEGCGPDCADVRVQRVEGLAEPVAAWLRAMADQISPPPRVVRRSVRDIDPEQFRQDREFNVLPRPTP